MQLYRLFGAAALLVTPVWAPSEDPSTASGTPSFAAADSSELNEEARKLQEAFEAFRESRLRRQTQRPTGGGCDLIIGRICLTHDEDKPLDWVVAEEPAEIERARWDLVTKLSTIADSIPGDAWVLGQRVHYIGEMGRWDAAEQLARRCGTIEEWWCHALTGMTLHAQDRFVESEEAFEEAFALMHEDERERWRNPNFLFDRAARGVLDDEGRDPGTELNERVWLMADPLYMIPGNDRKTEQYFREVLVRIRENASNPFQIEWAFDLEEVLKRYGGSLQWSRRRAPGMSMDLQESASMMGEGRPGSREFLPDGEFLAAPDEVPIGEWRLDNLSPRTAYSPSYAPEFKQIETQVARFRRGDSLYVVAAFQPEPDRPAPLSRAGVGAAGRGGRRQRGAVSSDPFGSVEAFIPEDSELLDAQVSEYSKSGLYLVRPDGSATYQVTGSGPSGVFEIMAPADGYILSIEVLDEERRTALRARHGVRQTRLAPDIATVSDILLVRDEGETPETLEEAIPRAVPNTRIPVGEAIVAAWEVYGLRKDEAVGLTVTVTDGAPGVLARAAQFFRMAEPEEPLELNWTEGAPGFGSIFFRSLRIDLSNLAPGDYQLQLEIVLRGRQPMLVEKPITIVAGG